METPSLGRTPDCRTDPEECGWGQSENKQTSQQVNKDSEISTAVFKPTVVTHDIFIVIFLLACLKYLYKRLVQALYVNHKTK